MICHGQESDKSGWRGEFISIRRHLQGDIEGGREERGFRELSVIAMWGRSWAVVSYHGLARDCRNERRGGAVIGRRKLSEKSRKGGSGIGYRELS